MPECLVIESIYDNVAICERDDRSTELIPLVLFPSNSKEGDWILVNGTEYIIDKEKSQDQKQHNISLLDKLKNKPKKNPLP